MMISMLNMTFKAIIILIIIIAIIITQKTLCVGSNFCTQTGR